MNDYHLSAPRYKNMMPFYVSYRPTVSVLTLKCLYLNSFTSCKEINIVCFSSLF